MARSRLFSARKNFIEEPVVNLTPLIDVVFVILIMFIVITPLLEIDRINLANSSFSDSSISHVHENTPLTIYVLEDNTVIFNQQKVNFSQLLMLLKQAKTAYPDPDTRPQVIHDRHAHFGTYQTVKNIIEEAGFSHLDIVLKPT